MTASVILTTEVETPCGTLVLGVVDGALCMCDWKNSARHERNVRSLCHRYHAVWEEGSHPLLVEAANQLHAYFDRRRTTFDHLPIRVSDSATLPVLSELQKLPYGEVVTYKEIAQRIGHPTAVRAVANIIASNPLSILIPCHRVIGSNGRLTGYAGGLEAKRLLLELEGANLSGERRLFPTIR